jgi:phosphoglycolate phosphatase
LVYLVTLLSRLERVWEAAGKELQVMEGSTGRTECVIYDCDGVLFDSLDANGRLYNRIATTMGRDVLSENELRYCHTHTVYDAIHHIFGYDGNVEKRALEFLKQVDLRDFIVYLRMEPNLLDTLGELKKRGIRRSISTNRTTSMKHVMERFQLWPYFDMVVTALDVNRPKPNPESVEKILAALEVKRENTLYVGDSEVDRETALSSGVRFVAYKNRELAADGYIEDHLTLLSLLADGTPPRG